MPSLPSLQLIADKSTSFSKIMKLSQPTPKARARIDDSSWLTKSSSLLASLIIFFSATQLGAHFWPSSAFVYGVRIDYLAPTLYFLDLLIISSLLLRRLFDRRPKQSSSLSARAGWDAEGGRSLLVGITPILLLNLLYSQNPLSTLSWSLHFLLYFLLLATTFENLRIWDLRFVLTLSLLFQLFLALVQVRLGHSVGGLMYYLGERSIAVGQPSVALATFMGKVVLRAYGTFSHPNILAGWAVVSLLILLRLKLSTTYQMLCTIVVSALVFLTQSRSAAIALFAIIIPFYILKSLRQRISYFFVVILLLSVAPRSLVVPSRSDLSLTQRLSLQRLSSQVISHFPILGTGAQASISTYPSLSPASRLLQPDHNSFTLLLSWFGVFGVLAIMYYLKHYLKIVNCKLEFILPILPLLLLDHYFLTSPQGVFIALLYLRLALNYPHAQNDRQ